MQLEAYYRINVTDATYAYEGTDHYYTQDEDVFNAFNVDSGRLVDVEIPEEFENDGAFEWLYSLQTEQSPKMPYILMNEIHLWSNDG